jgi:hypothetical protein
MKVKRPSRAVDPADWQRHMNLRLRIEFIAGAEEWRRLTGRPLTAAELERAAALSRGYLKLELLWLPPRK